MISNFIHFLTRKTTNLKSGSKDYFWAGLLFGGGVAALSFWLWVFIIISLGMILYVEEINEEVKREVEDNRSIEQD